jgi:RNA polymerase sigma-54 factor
VKHNQILTANQIQKMVLAPDLLQSLSILQMSWQELETYICQQLLENFMLEQEEGGVSNEDSEILSPNSLESPETPETNSPSKEDFWFGEGPEDIPGLYGQNEVKTYEIPGPVVLSLHEHLLAQLHMTDLSPKEKPITEFLIGNIDENGYLRCELQEVADIFTIPISVVENSLHLIQTFDPSGVGARTIGECLLLQLQAHSQYATEELSALAKTIISDYLNDIADGKLAKIACQLKTSLPQIQEALDFIRTLDPKPGRNFCSNHEICFIIPDVILRKIGNDYLIFINEPKNARLTISPFYHRLRNNKNIVDADVLKFTKDKQNAALQLIKAIEQRKLTLYQVTASVIAIQKDFLEKGVLYLKPLTLNQIADTVGIHESTVSRAISEKYIETPQGIYPYKFFFSTSLDSGCGEQVAAESVKKMIKTAVAEEDPKSPLSDQKLVELLKNKQITISRRTVTKYREEMLIPSSNKRRRF